MRNKKYSFQNIYACFIVSVTCSYTCHSFSSSRWNITMLANIPLTFIVFLNIKQNYFCDTRGIICLRLANMLRSLKIVPSVIIFVPWWQHHKFSSLIKPDVNDICNTRLSLDWIMKWSFLGELSLHMSVTYFIHGRGICEEYLTWRWESWIVSFSALCHGAHLRLFSEK